MGIVHTKLGEALRIERENRKIGLADISSYLKVPESVIEAIEDGRVGALPSDIYYKLFAKSYAEYLGIDYTATMEAIREELGEPPESPPVAETAADSGPHAGRTAKSGGRPTLEEEGGDKPAKKLAGWVILIVLVIAALAVSYKFLVRDNESNGEAAQAQRPQQTAEIDRSTEVTTAGEYLSGPFTMSLLSHGQSWVTVLVDGESAINRELSEGESVEFSANTSMVVSISEPLLVDAFINSRPVDLIDSRTQSIVRVIVNHNTLGKYLPPTTDTTAGDTVQSPDSGQKVDTTTR